MAAMEALHRRSNGKPQGWGTARCCQAGGIELAVGVVLVAGAEICPDKARGSNKKKHKNSIC
jgi:hypothetical protein